MQYLMGVADQFSPLQRRVALQVQATDVLSMLANQFAFPASIALRMRMLGNDAGLLAVVTGNVHSGISLGNLVLGPLVGRGHHDD